MDNKKFAIIIIVALSLDFVIGIAALVLAAIPLTRQYANAGAVTVSRNYVSGGPQAGGSQWNQQQSGPQAGGSQWNQQQSGPQTGGRQWNQQQSGPQAGGKRWNKQQFGQQIGGPQSGWQQWGQKQYAGPESGRYAFGRHESGKHFFRYRSGHASGRPGFNGPGFKGPGCGCQRFNHPGLNSPSVP